MLIGGTEAYLRLRAPFNDKFTPSRLVPGVGYTYVPGAQIRRTNNLDYWTVSTANSLGFLDREPIPPEKAAATCHVAVLGDSFVEASEVPIDDKFHVQLERLAATKLPALRVTTSAYGRRGTAQINQLPYYDRFIRPSRPKMVLLVFVHNDFRENSPILKAMGGLRDPDHLPLAFAYKASDGSMALRPPAVDWARRQAALHGRIAYHEPAQSTASPPAETPRRGIAGLLQAKTEDERSELRKQARQRRQARLWSAYADLISQRPRYARAFDGWNAERGYLNHRRIRRHLVDAQRAPVFAEAIEFTEFALDEFLQRSRRDGFHLAILAIHHLPRHDVYALLLEIARARGIPLIDLRQYILGLGANPEDAHFRHDSHWSPQGHRWAAQAVLAHLAARGVCAQKVGELPPFGRRTALRELRLNR